MICARNSRLGVRIKVQQDSEAEPQPYHLKLRPIVANSFPQLVQGRPAVDPTQQKRSWRKVLSVFKGLKTYEGKYKCPSSTTSSYGKQKFGRLLDDFRSDHRAQKDCPWYDLQPSALSHKTVIVHVGGQRNLLAGSNERV